MHPSAKKSLETFLAEDIGKGDITSKLLPRKKIVTNIIAHQEGIIAGVQYAREIFVSRKCKVRIRRRDGYKVRPNQKIMLVSGSAYSILSCERTVLNLLSRMSGIATQTNFLAKLIRSVNPRVALYSTRKTVPGLRIFDKEAVEIGGGHRLWTRVVPDDLKPGARITKGGIDDGEEGGDRQHGGDGRQPNERRSGARP